MVTNPETASQLKELLSKCFELLVESEEVVQATASNEEFLRYRRAVGAVMPEIDLEILHPLLKDA